MKKLLLGATLLALGVAPALAADMPEKARPAPAAVASAYNWTGFYAGLNAGYGWGDASSTNAPVDPGSQSFFGFFPSTDFDTSFRQSGAIAGGQIGYNWQFSDRVVAGIETDLQWSDLRGSQLRVSNVAGLGASSFNAVAERRLEWFGTFRGRLGFLATPNLLLYGTGGLAYGEARSSGNIVLASGGGFTITTSGPTFSCFTLAPNCYAGNDRQTSIGWSAGAGGELRLGNNWSVKLEYLHIDLPSTSVRFISPPPSDPGVSTIYRFNHQAYDFVRAGFNYAFGGPVVAKY
jgi:outer membrane immunogenic protein